MILNLTQHAATPEQVAEGVTDLPAEQRAALCTLLTFDELPRAAEIEDRAVAIAEMAVLMAGDAHQNLDDEVANVAGDPVGVRAMIGGAPYLMSCLEGALIDRDIQPVYAFTRRVVVEQQQPDGTVKKTAVFRHAGFVAAMSS